MENEAHSEQYKGCTIRLEYDEHPESPREWCNVGTMVCWHRRYNLGDEQPKESPDERFLYYVQGGRRWNEEKAKREAAIRASHPRPDLCGTDEEREETEDSLNVALDAVEGDMEDDVELCRELFDRDNIHLPLYLYDHSGITISTGRFSCPWDSSQVGFIYCSKTKAREEWGPKYFPGITDEQIWGKAEAYLESEVSTYDGYLTGQVVGYVVSDPDDREIASCWGFYPDEKGNWPDAVEQAKAEIDAWVAKQEREAAEKAYWETRDVETVPV